MLVSQCVAVQNQHGLRKLKWEMSGVIVKNLGNSSYLVKLDGSGRISKRRRQYLKPINPFMGGGGDSFDPMLKVKIPEGPIQSKNEGGQLPRSDRLKGTNYFSEVLGTTPRTVRGEFIGSSNRNKKGKS